MNKVTLKIGEILELEAELNGIVDQQTGKVVLEGLVSKDLKLTTKYWLSDLNEKVAKEKAAVGKLRDELIKKHGKADEQGNINIPMYINEVRDEEGKLTSAEINPDFAKFQEDYAKLLEETVEISHKEFSLEDFEDVKSKEFPKVFFKLLTVPEFDSE